jgi:NAD(P)-dependent dehydrogenase (short-subunit alcohol dehydrogenase family)
MDGISRLDGYIALITGGTGGLGGAVTETLLRAGATTLVTYQDDAARDALQRRMAKAGLLDDQPGRLEPVHVDVTDSESIEACVRDGVTRHGKIDVLVTIVGGYLGGKDVSQMTAAEWKGMLDLNLTSTFLCCRAVLPPMIERNYGRIVAVSSRSAVQPARGVSAYAVSKRGVLTLIESIAEENHSRNVTANAVLPGIIDTPANRQGMPTAQQDRWTKPEEIARVIAFLVSPEAGIINGAAIPVYGQS